MEHLSAISSFSGWLSVGNTALSVMDVDVMVKPSGPVERLTAGYQVLLEGCKPFCSLLHAGTVPAPFFFLIN